MRAAIDEVLRPGVKAVGSVPDGVLTIGIDPDWRPSHLAHVFADEGRLLRGTVLFTATDPSP